MRRGRRAACDSCGARAATAGGIVFEPPDQRWRVGHVRTSASRVRSCVTSTTAAGVVRIARARSSTSGTDRWFVGSSSIRTGGRPRQEHARQIDPPSPSGGQAPERPAEVGVGEEAGGEDRLPRCRLKHVERRVARVRGILLSEQAGLRAGPDRERSGVPGRLPGQHRQKRGLPGAVGAADEQAIAGGQADAGVGRQRHPAGEPQPAGLHERPGGVRAGREVERERPRWRRPASGQDVVQPALQQPDGRVRPAGAAVLRRALARLPAAGCRPCACAPPPCAAPARRRPPGSPRGVPARRRASRIAPGGTRRRYRGTGFLPGRPPGRGRAAPSPRHRAASGRASRRP
jgi:hypothetical protein